MDNLLPNANSERQVNIDLAKFFAIVFMVVIHVFLSYVEDFSEGFYYVVNSVLGGPLSAPIFMVSMGVGFAYSKKQDPNMLIKRGLNILILGYFLNILIYPNVFIAIFEQAEPEIIMDEIFTSFFSGDLFQFAGLAMILFGLLRKLGSNDTGILIAGIALSLVFSFIPFIDTDSYLISIICGLFVPVNHSSCLFMVFPLSVWFIFPAFGYWFGNKLKNIKNLDRFYLIAGGACLLISGIGIGLEAYLRVFMMEAGDLEFYFMSLHDALLCIASTIAMYALCHFIVKILPKIINKGIVAASSSLNIIYMLSWIIIVIFELVVYSFVDEVYGLSLCLITVAAIVLSLVLGVLIKKAILKKLEKSPDSFFKYLNP